MDHKISPKKNFLLYFYNPIIRFAVKKAGVKDDRYSIIDVFDIHYVFHCGKAGIPKTVRSVSDFPNIPNGIYVRTVKGFYLMSYRSLERLKKDLNPVVFSQIGKSVMVNIFNISELDLREKVKEVGVLVNGTIEWLTVSRRYMKGLRRRVGLSTVRRIKVY